MILDVQPVDGADDPLFTTRDSVEDRRSRGGTVGAGNPLHRLLSTEPSAEGHQARSNDLLAEITGGVRNQTCSLSTGHKYQPFSSPVIDSSFGRKNDVDRSRPMSY